MSKYVTKEGLEKLQKELEELKTIKREEIRERLKNAISFGDLSENFDYHDAREQQDMLETHIAELEKEIREAQIIESTTQSETVQVGSVVGVEANGERMTYTIVTAQQANPLEGKISAESPIGSSLLGKKVGEKALCETPGGKMECKVVSIK